MTKAKRTVSPAPAGTSQKSAGREERYLGGCTAKPSMIVALCFFLVPICATASRGDILYDINFQGPMYTVGSYIPVATSGAAPRDKVTRTNYGEQVVRSSFGPLGDQPAEFIARTTPGGSFRYSQVQMQMNDMAAFPRYELSFDAWLGSAAPSSTLKTFWDVPDVVTLSLTGDGRVIRNLGSVSASQIGTFDPMEIVSVDWVVDLSANRCQIMVNDALQYSGIFHTPYPAHPDPPTYVRAIRLNFSGQTDGESVGIDNIKAYGIPEPGTMMLLGVGGILLRRRR